MSKMSKKKKRRNLSKLFKKFTPPKIRREIAPPTKVFKSIKDYDRSENKKIIERDIDG